MIKEKVLKEDFGIDDEVVGEIVDSALAEVGKVIDEMDAEDFKHIKFKRPYFRGKEELKQKLGI